MHEILNTVVCATSTGLRSACAYAQSDQRLCLWLEISISVKLLTYYLLEVLSLKGGCTGSSESTLAKRSNCLKSHATTQIFCHRMNDLQFKIKYPPIFGGLVKQNGSI